MGWGCYKHEWDIGSEAWGRRLEALIERKLKEEPRTFGRDGQICPACYEELEGQVRQYKTECERLHREVNALTRNEVRIKQIVDEKLLRERDQYNALARELAAELRRWFEFKPFVWRLDPSGSHTRQIELHRRGFLALRGSAAELLSRPEVKVLKVEDKA